MCNPSHDGTSLFLILSLSFHLTTLSISRRHPNRLGTITSIGWIAKYSLQHPSQALRCWHFRKNIFTLADLVEVYGSSFGNLRLVRFTRRLFACILERLIEALRSERFNGNPVKMLPATSESSQHGRYLRIFRDI